MKPKCQNSGVREAPRGHLFLGEVTLQNCLRGNEYCHAFMARGKNKRGFSGFND
jgi:hypothetical protein